MVSKFQCPLPVLLGYIALNAFYIDFYIILQHLSFPALKYHMLHY